MHLYFIIYATLITKDCNQRKIVSEAYVLRMTRLYATFSDKKQEYFSIIQTEKIRAICVRNTTIKSAIIYQRNTNNYGEFNTKLSVII